MKIYKSILEVVVKPQICIIWTAAVDVCTRNDESAKLGARVTVIAIKDIGSDFHVQILSDVPGRPGLQYSGRISDVVDAC